MARLAIVPVTTHVYSTVTEQRAPTDASVALLKEMEQAARDKVLQSIALEGNTLNGVVHIERRFESDDAICRVVFDLNGRRQTVDVAIDHGDQVAGVDAVVRKVVEAVAHRVASDIVGPAIMPPLVRSGFLGKEGFA